MKSLKLVLGLSVILFFGCKNATQKDLLTEDTFKFETEGKQIQLYSIQNANGLVCQFTDYGARVVSLWVPDKNGNWNDVVVGYGSAQDFVEKPETYFGATIGRYGNRIGASTFSIDSVPYQLDANDGVNHLHGGTKGLHKRIWDVNSTSDNSIAFTYFSADMEEGYPGNVHIKVVYTLSDDNALEIAYEADADKKTVLNLTNHAYFNLTGDASKTINGHQLMINASRYTPVDAVLIPTGKLATVKDTPFDFTTLTAIGDRVNDENEQLSFGKGYDHNWVLEASNEALGLAAKVVEPESGRVMEIFTTEPGLQFYGGNFLDGSLVGKYNTTILHRAAFCLETQHFPDSPNQENFPTVIVNPNEKYTTKSVYKFSGF